MKSSFRIFAVGCVVLISGILAGAVQAVPIQGEVGFDGFLKATKSGSRVDLMFTHPVSVDSGSGDYALTIGSLANFTNFSFTGSGTSAVLVGGSVSSLWFFTSGLSTYSFDLTGLDSATFANIGGVRNLNLEGTGLASIAGPGGYMPTAGTFVLSGLDNSLTFQFFAGPMVPDGGATVALLGLALVGLAAWHRVRHNQVC